jgi:peptidoglycan hydrolase-like protein with peptidoglycan-binding domain
MPATLQLGDSGDDVKRLQRVFVREKQLGPADLDGVFGATTDQVVRDFQQATGLAADGIVGPLTWSQLPPYREASPLLQQGSLGPVVGLLQQVLAAGFGYDGAIDGRYGPLTGVAVRAFQVQASLPATGVMEENTWLAPAGAAGATLESLAGLNL